MTLVSAPAKDQNYYVQFAQFISELALEPDKADFLKLETSDTSYRALSLSRPGWPLPPRDVFDDVSTALKEPHIKEFRSVEYLRTLSTAMRLKAATLAVPELTNPFNNFIFLRQISVLASMYPSLTYGANIIAKDWFAENTRLVAKAHMKQCEPLRENVQDFNIYLSNELERLSAITGALAAAISIPGLGNALPQRNNEYYSQFDSFVFRLSSNPDDVNILRSHTKDLSRRLLSSSFPAWELPSEAVFDDVAAVLQKHDGTGFKDEQYLRTMSTLARLKAAALSVSTLSSPFSDFAFLGQVSTIASTFPGLAYGANIMARDRFSDTARNVAANHMKRFETLENYLAHFDDYIPNELKRLATATLSLTAVLSVPGLGSAFPN